MRHGRTDDEGFTPDPRDLTDGEILERLSDGGIEITIDDFKAEAMKAGSPEMLAGNWAYMYKEWSADEDSFLYSAIFELWRRHLGYEKRTPEIVAEFIDDIFNTYEESPEANEQYFLLNIYERVREFYHKLLKEEALIQIEENIIRFPEEMWVIINAGDAMYNLGEKESAERYFLRAKNMVVTKSDHMVVLERLLDLYRELGMKDRAKVIENEIKALDLPLRNNNRNS